MTKACRKCGEVKPLEEFKLCSGGKWRIGACNDCEVKRHRERRKRLAYPVSVTEKECASCGEVKPASAFHPVPMNTDGLRGHCRECHKALPSRRSGARKKQRRKDAVRAGRAYRTEQSIKTGQRFREHLRRVDAALRPPVRRCNPERTRGWVKQLLQDDPSARGLAWTSQVYRARYRYDPEFRAKEMGRRYAQKQADLLDDGTLTPAVMRRLFAAAKRCPDCGRKLGPRDKSLDHIEPKSRGGAHSIFNARVVCRSCNSKKHATLPMQIPLSVAA
ncbi:MAG TPA: HNH endonuclease signature motif containing protein [Longimicrobiaceae bacterium]